MKTILLSEDTLMAAPCAATIGFFDGVHLGHRHLLKDLCQMASQRGLSAVAVTFARHPRQVVQTDWHPQLLTTLDEKTALLAETGIDQLVVLPFDEAMAALTAREFMRQVLYRQLGVRLLLTGYDNHFGHRTPQTAAEGFDDYVVYGREIGMEVLAGTPLTPHLSPLTPHPSPLTSPPFTVSSSVVRRLLQEGRAEEAARCLGRPYMLAGMVAHGQQIGRQMGYPTANLQPDDPQKLIPREGVYAVQVETEGVDGRFSGVTNIGSRPTFQGAETTIETHLIDFHGDVYGRRLKLYFLRWLRQEQQFASPALLARQIEEDIRQATL
jgi:riboflavin kinase/FMN adenylyltransferase